MLDNQINAATATLRLKAVVPNPARALWPNAFVKARALLDWAPQYGGRDGFLRAMTATCNWFRDPANLRRYKADIYNL